MIKKISHCQVPYLKRTRVNLFDNGFRLIYRNSFLFRNREFEFIIFQNQKGDYGLKISFHDCTNSLVGIYFRVYGKYCFSLCPFGEIADLVSVMYSDFMNRTNC